MPNVLAAAYYARMKRAVTLSLALWLGLVAALQAQGPDDQFIQIYNLIQQADALRESGQTQSAREKYIQANEALRALRRSSPVWNPSIVNYRSNYIAERLGPMPAPTAATEVPAATPAAKAAAAATEDRANQIKALEDSIQSLRAEKEALDAKLREALSAQPATADPKELAKAEDRAKELQKENELLKANAAQQQERLGKLADPAALEEARKALRQSNEEVVRQTEKVSALTKERQTLEQRLKALTAKPDAKTLAQEKKAAQTSKTTEAQTKVASLTEALRKSQDELASQKSRAQALQTEKAALEKRISELSSRPAVTLPPVASVAPVTPTAPVTTTPAPATEKPKTAAQIKAEKSNEKAQIKWLERERDDMRKKVTALTRELEDRRVRKGAAQAGQLADELTILRARIEVYEARVVPYSAEEKALFQATPSMNSGIEPNKVGKKSSRDLPAGAASLAGEARRAFDTRHYDEAEKKLLQVLKLDEKNLSALKFLAAAQMEQTRYDDADATLKRALAEDPNDAEALSLRGLLLFRQQKNDEALDVLGRAAQLNPDDARTQTYLGVVLSDKGQRGPAETALRRAIQLQPDNAEAHYNLALVYATQKPPFLEMARWHYQKALAAGQPKKPEMEKLLQGPAK